MDFIIGFIIIFIVSIFVSFGSSMIILCFSCGMALLNRAKQEKIIFQNAPNKYIPSVIIWSVILIGITTILFILLKKYRIFLIIGLFIGLLNGSKAFKFKNNSDNIQEFLKTYEDYLIKK